MAHKEDPNDEDRCDASDSDNGSECLFDLAADRALVHRPSTEGSITLNEYLPESGDEEDDDQNITDSDEYDDDDDEDDDEDSEDQAICDPSCQPATMLVPDRRWNPDVVYDDSEDD